MPLSPTPIMGAPSLVKRTTAQRDRWRKKQRWFLRGLACAAGAPGLMRQEERPEEERVLHTAAEPSDLEEQMIDGAIQVISRADEQRTSEAGGKAEKIQKEDPKTSEAGGKTGKTQQVKLEEPTEQTDEGISEENMNSHQAEAQMNSEAKDNRKAMAERQ